MRWRFGFLLLAAPSQAAIKELPRERVDKLSLADFRSKYVDKLKPVILEFPNASLHWTAIRDWEQNYFLNTCPAGKIFPVQYYTGSVEWGGFDPNATDTISFQDLFDLWDQTSYSDKGPAYGFDFNIKCHCPDLFEDFEVLKYFLTDEVIVSPVGAAATYPSMMMGPVGSKSGMHTDKYFLPFWLTLLQGRKRWRVITHSDWNSHLREFFGNQLAGVMTRAFDVFDDTFLKRTPAFKKVTVWTGDLLPGDTVYVPTAGAHAGFNLHSPRSDAAIAITANFIDRFHKPQIADTFCDLNLPTAIANDDSVVCPIATGAVEGAKLKKVEDIPLAKEYMSHVMSRDFCDLHSRGRFGWNCTELASKCDDAGFGKKIAAPCPDHINEDRMSPFRRFDRNEDGVISVPEYQVEMARRIIDHKFKMGVPFVNKTVFHDTKYAIGVYQKEFKRKDINRDDVVSCSEYFADVPEPTQDSNSKSTKQRRKKASSEL